MGLYNFQKRFVPFIESGDKTHTIRAKRKLTPKVGETLHLYTGLRQKGSRLLMRVPCTKVEEIRMDADGSVVIDGVTLSHDEAEHFAKRDGFSGHAERMKFWEGKYPFEGHIIHWRQP